MKKAVMFAVLTLCGALGASQARAEMAPEIKQKLMAAMKSMGQGMESSKHCDFNRKYMETIGAALQTGRKGILYNELIKNRAQSVRRISPNKTSKGGGYWMGFGVLGKKKNPAEGILLSISVAESGGSYVSLIFLGSIDRTLKEAMLAVDSVPGKSAPKDDESLTVMAALDVSEPSIQDFYGKVLRLYVCEDTNAR